MKANTVQYARGFSWYSREAGEPNTINRKVGVRNAFPREKRRVDEFGGGEFGTAVDADTLPPRALRKAVALARRGFFSRATSALAASAVADSSSPDAQAAMAALHPRASAAEAAALAAAVPPPPESALDLEDAAIMSALRSFKLGATGGPSLLAAGHLLAACGPTGGTATAEVCDLVRRFASGRIPGFIKPVLFGARLVGLEKTGGGIRPVAAGETLRRLCAKAVFAAVKAPLRDILLPHGQVGVGVPAGLEAAVFAARRFGLFGAGFAPGHADERCVLKVDLRNAFNSLRRSAIISAFSAAPTLAGAAPYVFAALASPSSLFFGEACVIPSEVGAQQGDNGGPAAFAVTSSPVVSCAAADTGMELLAQFLDDVAAGGRLRDVAAFAPRLELSLAGVGLELIGRR